MNTHRTLAVAAFSLVGFSVAVAAEPAIQQIEKQAQERTLAAKQFGADLEQRFIRRDRRIAEDQRQELKLTGALSDALANETHATLQHVECRSHICKASIELANREDRPHILFALLASHECGVAVPENNGTTVLAYLDCSTAER